MLFLHDCHDPLNCSTFTPTNMVGDLYYLLMASLAYTSPCMGVINRLIGCYASGNLYFVYFFCLFFMCGGSVVFLNSLEMEGDEMNILVLKWANQDYFWSQVCEISWDPLIYYWGTWLLALISLQLRLGIFWPMLTNDIFWPTSGRFYWSASTKLFFSRYWVNFFVNAC